MNRWPYIKAAGAHLGADWCYQTTAQAAHKQTDARYRAQHVAIMAGSHTVAAWTCDGVPMARRALYVAVNAVTHYLIDGVVMPKWLDQALHLAIALASAKLLETKR